MNPQQLSTLRNRSLPAFEITLLVLFFITCAIGFVSSGAQAPQANAAPAQQEREFKNTIPDHVPLRVKIKHEQTFKNAVNKNWAREFEIEVKNTGDKPIYFIYLLLVLPDVQVNGYPYALQLTYGRNELVRLSTPVQPDDRPIQPGETITMSISQDELEGYENSRDKESRSEAKKVQLDMQLINFGDGTGLTGADGHKSRPRLNAGKHAGASPEMTPPPTPTDTPTPTPTPSPTHTPPPSCDPAAKPNDSCDRGGEVRRPRVLLPENGLT